MGVAPCSLLETFNMLLRDVVGTKRTVTIKRGLHGRVIIQNADGWIQLRVFVFSSMTMFAAHIEYIPLKKNAQYSTGVTEAIRDIYNSMYISAVLANYDGLERSMRDEEVLRCIEQRG